MTPPDTRKLAPSISDNSGTDTVPPACKVMLPRLTLASTGRSMCTPLITNAVPAASTRAEKLRSAPESATRPDTKRVNCSSAIAPVPSVSKFTPWALVKLGMATVPPERTASVEYMP